MAGKARCDAPPIFLPVLSCPNSKGAARRAAGGAVAAAIRVVGGRAGVGLRLRAEMAVAIAERVEEGVESGFLGRKFDRMMPS